ncbi:MAG TPA: efflux RND transporter periplasmic adaptor subunit [Steroidobacteraceae bacterium]|nr:efflux RND transporter periplasmic adaptor subunit [Steroidobacteraceae bacterium]
MHLLPVDSARRRQLLIAIAVVGVIAVTGSIYALTRDGASKTDAPIVYELAPTDVQTLKAQPLTRTLRVSGSLTPLRHAVVKSHSAGTVLEIRVHEGDRVRSGQLLARIDPRNLKAELDSRIAALRKAEADLSLATKNRDNSVTLLKQKLISQNAFDQTEATYEASIANKDAAEAQVRMAEIALSDTEIRAEFDGVVATRTAQVGERVMPDSPLLSLVDLVTMELEALVPMADVPEIKPGQVSRFKVDGFGAREFTGHVERINPQAQPGTRSLTVYLSVANPDGALKGGMFAEGDLVIHQTTPVFALPNNAIRREADKSYVLVVKNGTIARLDVAVGERFEDMGLNVIREGLSDNMQIIVAPITSLKPGVSVKLPSASAAST